MIKKSYVKNSPEISPLGFGAWPLGNKAHGKTMSEAEGIALIRDALKKGINFFDTAPNYANGRSETILGKALKGKREDVVINSKFGHHPDGTIDFGEDKIRPSIEGSLKRLQTDYLDSVLLHNPDQSILAGETKHFDILKDLKNEGLIKAYGVSIDTASEIKQVLKRDDIEVVELLFNIFSQSCRDHLDALKKKGIALIIKVPLDSGWLAGKYHKHSTFTDIRARWTKDDLDRRHNLIESLKATLNDRVSPKYALGFIWQYDAVTTIIPGIRNQAQLNDHLKALAFEFPKDIKPKLEAFYDQHIAHDPLPW